MVDILVEDLLKFDMNYVNSLLVSQVLVKKKIDYFF